MNRFLLFLLLLFALVSTFTPTLFAGDNEHVSLSDFPPQDLPTAADRENLIGESAKNFYYGIGEPVDYKKARLAAMLEMDPQVQHLGNEDNENEFSAPSILMMIYANGFGVEKNIDLSVRLAEFYVNGSASEMDERIQHIKKMNNLFHGVFDVCDDVPVDSGSKNNCYDQHKFDYYLWNLVPKEIQNKLPSRKEWPQEEINSFDDLGRMANAYFSKRIMYELDDSGTDQSDIQTDETHELENDFLEILALLETGKLPVYSATDCLKSGSDLNQTYFKLLKIKDFHLGSVNSTGIRVVQRRWLAYCDAWVQLAALRYPNVSSDSLRKVLTDARDAQLLALLKLIY